ncbi:MAG: hypothetical protein ACLPX1_12705 [Steroidobacteraceae bacterium]
MEAFLNKHAGDVTGVLSGFDRLVFRGTLRYLAHHLGMMTYLRAVRVLLKDFASHAAAATQQLRAASEGQAQAAGRPIVYVRSSAISKEDLARRIARRDGIERGLICIIKAVEPCVSYDIIRDRKAKRLHLRPRHRKCLFLYHYQIHPVFGFMHARIQTWFPFPIQVCLNGREWLARTMDAGGLSYVRRDNCFIRLQDPAQAQRLMQRQVEAAWPDLLNGIADSLNPQHKTMFRAFPVKYYWSTHQSEWATDILFRTSASLARLYPRLVQHGLTSFLSPDVMRFLGRNIPPSGQLPPQFNAEVVSDVKRRPEGVRIKHRLGENSIKMYDKQGSVLRVETTINDAAGFKTFRTPEGKPEAPQGWHCMRKGIADLHRRTEVSQAANDRYLQAQASVENATPLGELTARLCRPAKRNGRRVRALNPHAPADAALIEALGRGEFCINGFRNRDLRQLLFTRASMSKPEQRRQAAVVSRKLALLRAHHLIRKVPHTHRYHLTEAGRIAVTALITARNASTQELTKLAA